MKKIISFGIAILLVQYVVFGMSVIGLKSVADRNSGWVRPVAPEVIEVTPTAVPATDRHGTPAPSVTEAPQPTVAEQAIVQTPADNRCIIAVHGARYDVTEFRTIHQGGDVFSCGADVTALFDSRHDMDTLAKLARYLVP